MKRERERDAECRSAMFAYATLLLAGSAGLCTYARMSIDRNGPFVQMNNSLRAHPTCTTHGAPQFCTEALPWNTFLILMSVIPGYLYSDVDIISICKQCGGLPARPATTAAASGAQHVQRLSKHVSAARSTLILATHAHHVCQGSQAAGSGPGPGRRHSRRVLQAVQGAAFGCFRRSWQGDNPDIAYYPAWPCEKAVFEPPDSSSLLSD